MKELKITSTTEREFKEQAYEIAKRVTTTDELTQFINFIGNVPLDYGTAVMESNVKPMVLRVKTLHKPLRLPRKLKKDIIKTSGRESYWKIVGLMCMQFMMHGSQYVKIRKQK